MVVIQFTHQQQRLIERRSVPSERRFVEVLEVWRERSIYRKMLRDELLRQPDSVLEDAGVDRKTAEAEARKPFWRA